MTQTAKKATDVIGVTGLSIWKGILQEEYLTVLKGKKAVKVFKEMEDDAVVGALLDAIRMPLLAAEFRVTPASDSDADTKAADFVWECMHDMTRYSWRQHVLDVLDMMVFGWAASEIVFKKRLGPEKSPASKYNDGKLGLHILDPRGQETLQRWKLDDEGNVEQMVQRDPVTGEIHEIPSWKMVHATFRSRKRSPEGRSPLRSLYRAWYTRKNLEVIEAIGAERDLAGLPVIKLPPGASDDDKAEAEKIVRNIRLDEEAGVVLPKPPTGSELGWELVLLSSGGSKAYNTRDIIRDLNKIILMRFFAQFLLLGMENVGTQALVKGSHDFFSLALISVQQELLETWNWQLIPLLFQFNPFPGRTGLPELDWADPGKADMVAMANLLKELVGVDIITPSAELEDYIRELAGLPDRPEGLGEGPRGGRLPTGFEFRTFAQKEVAGTEVKGTAGRRLPGKMERETNKYQAELLAVYDRWSVGLRRALVNGDKAGLSTPELIGVVDANISTLAERLKAVGRKGIKDAVTLGMKGAEPDAEALRLIADRVDDNERFIDDSLIPGVRAKLIEHIMESSEVQRFALDELALTGALTALRVRTSGYSGAFWSAIFEGAALMGKRDDAERRERGEKTRPVRWVLDPNAVHCQPSPGFYGCEELAGEYESWDAMPTVPAGQVTCRGNCRCHIEVWNPDRQDWERVA